MPELIDMQIRLPKELHAKIEALGAMCGLTAEQMAGAIFILSQQTAEVVDEPRNG